MLKMFTNYSEKRPNTVPSFKSWLIWTFASLFYFYEMILRASPSVMTQDLMRDFSVDSTSLGVLTSFYYYAYVILQVPCGIIVDRLGTRRVITFSTLLCVLGSFCFAYSTTLPLAQFGRFLIGAGSACAFISCLKISSDWFLPAQFALIASLTNMMGTVGGMFSGPPFALLVNNFGWRQATIIAAYVGVGLAGLCWMVIRERNPSVVVKDKKAEPFLSNLIYITRQPRLWVFAIFGGLMYVPISAFCELWAVPFLMKKYGVSNEIASYANVMLYFGIAVGSPIAAKLSDHFQSRVKVMSLSAICTTGLFLAILYLPQLTLNSMFALLFCAGVFNGGQILCFTCVKEAVPAHMSGTAMGFTNAGVMMSGVIFQPLLGMLLDFFWDGLLDGQGIPFYTIYAYEAAILAVPACLSLSWVLLRFIPQPSSMPDEASPAL